MRLQQLVFQILHDLQNDNQIHLFLHLFLDNFVVTSFAFWDIFLRADMTVSLPTPDGPDSTSNTPRDSCLDSSTDTSSGI